MTARCEPALRAGARRRRIGRRRGGCPPRRGGAPAREGRLLSRRVGVRVGAAHVRASLDRRSTGRAHRGAGAAAEGRRSDPGRDRGRAAHPAPGDLARRRVAPLPAAPQLLCVGMALSASCYEPKVLVERPACSKVSTEEVFGPVSASTPTTSSTRRSRSQCAAGRFPGRRVHARLRDPDAPLRTARRFRRDGQRPHPPFAPTGCRAPGCASRGSASAVFPARFATCRRRRRSWDQWREDRAGLDATSRRNPELASSLLRSACASPWG